MSNRNVQASILAEIEWDEGLSLPVANAENKKLENEVQTKQTLLVSIQNELADTDERTRAMREHLKNVWQELHHTQALVTAREKELQTESHLLKVAQREDGRLKQEVSRLMKDMDDMKEKKNMHENKIFKQTQKLEEVRAQMNWDKQTLEAWLEESTRRDEDAMTLQKYTRQDEAKIRELSGLMEKLMDEALKKRNHLHSEITTTIQSQVELDKIADDFRRAHMEREELLSQWENTIDQMQKRDREIDQLATKLAIAKNKVKENDAVIQEKLRFMQHEKDASAELDKKITAADRLSAQLRSELLQAEQQKHQFENETNTLKRTVDRTALDLELARIAIHHLKKEITDKSSKLQHARSLRQSLMEKLKLAVNSTLTAAEHATAMEDHLYAEERKQEGLALQMKRLGELLYRKDKALTDIRKEEKMMEATINGTNNTIKNLGSKINRLDSDALKQQEILYSQDYTLQQLEQRLLRMQGEHNREEKSVLESNIATLQKELEAKDDILFMLRGQTKRVQEDTRHLKVDADKYRANKLEQQKKTDELTNYNSISELQVKQLINKKQSFMVDENLLKLKIKKLQDMLNSHADGVTSLEKRKLQLNTAMKERQLEIKIHQDMLRAQVKATDEERQQISAELHERVSKIDKMKKRFEIMTVSMSPPEGEEERSQAYYVIKAAQEKEELQREGDGLDAQIRKAEREMRALENTLKLMNGRNEQYRKSFHKVTETGDEMDEKHQLDEQQRAVMDKYKYKRRQLKELHEDLHTMSFTLENVSKDEESYLAVIVDKQHKMTLLKKETEDQKEKLTRVTNQNVRLSKALRAAKKLREELPEEKDIRVRELRDFIRDTSKSVGEVTTSIPEVWEAVQLYFSQANLTPPTTSRSQTGSSRSSAASSARSSRQIPVNNIYLTGSSASSSSSARSKSSR